MAKFAFRSDTVALKGWLAKRKKSLEDARLPFEPVWRDIRLHIEPSLGKALVDWSQKKRYSWETPLNPYVTPGQAATLTLKDESTASVHITAVTDTFSTDGGFWSRWEGKV